MTNATFDDVMSLASKVKDMDAQNFAAADKLIEMLKLQMGAFDSARTEYAATIEVKDLQIATRNADYAELNARNTEIAQRLTIEQSERQGVSAALVATNQLLAATVTDAEEKTRLLAEAAAAALEARQSFDTEKVNAAAQITSRDATIEEKNSIIDELNLRAQQTAQLFQDNLDKIAAQFSEILEANISEDADAREVAANGMTAE